MPADSRIGKKIRIIQMEDHFAGDRYNGREGYITSVDDMGHLHGTWGFLALIPRVDEYEYIKD